MSVDQDLHADLSEFVVVNSEEVTWQPTIESGIFKKPFDKIRTGKLARESCLYKYDAGAALRETTFEDRLEILVIKGRLALNGTYHSAGVYVRLPPSSTVSLGSPEGCVFFFRSRAGAGNEHSDLVVDLNDRSRWHTWGGRGNQKIPLQDPAEPGIGSWLGYMFPEHQAPKHDHPGGEEVLILHGALEDHRGTCGSGTWVRYPVDFVHSPTAHKDGALMLVREGDVKNLE